MTISAIGCFYVEKMGAVYVEHLDDFWGQFDYLTIHTPKTKETAGLINTNTLNRMKKGVRIINCARGGIIDEAALKEAGYNTNRIRKEKIMGESMLQKLRSGQLVSWATIDLICDLLDCQPGDLIEFIQEPTEGVQ